MSPEGSVPHGVVAIGDSWLTGYGLSLAGLTCSPWSSWLAWARVTCLTVHAVNGSTAHHVVADQLPLLGPRRYELGVAWLGANDISHLDADRFADAMGQICRALRDSCEVVAVATLPESLRTPDLSWRRSAQAVRQANACVRSAADQAGVTLVELADSLSGPWSMAPDRQHPTSLGQLEAAHVAANTLQGLRLLRHLPPVGSCELSKQERRMYDVSARERLRGRLAGIRQDRARVRTPRGSAPPR